MVKALDRRSRGLDLMLNSGSAGHVLVPWASFQSTPLLSTKQEWVPSGTEIGTAWMDTSAENFVAFSTGKWDCERVRPHILRFSPLNLRGHLHAHLLLFICLQIGCQTWMEIFLSLLAYEDLKQQVRVDIWTINTHLYLYIRTHSLGLRSPTLCY